ncbi:MAG: VOC family protein [Pseudomonadota bacterium]
MRILVVLFFLISTYASAETAPASSFVHIKRPSLVVPDLDEAVLFYRDVLGFKVDAIGDLDVKAGSVLIDLFNIEPGAPVRRALFSSSTSERALFVMETPGAPAYDDADKRHSIQVVQTKDLAAVVARAREHGFHVGVSNSDTSASSGATFTETAIMGPGGQAVLVYQFDR